MVNRYKYEDVDVWIQRHLNLCDVVASWSKDPSSKFGCFITDQKFRPIAYGFNGFARGFKDTVERWNNREFKYRHVIHAEENAILNATGNLEGSIAFVNGCPCSSCMSKLAQSGISSVWCWKPTEEYMQRWSVDEPLQVAYECGVRVNFVSRMESTKNEKGKQNDKC